MRAPRAGGAFPAEATSGKAVREAWELVESHEARGSVRDVYAVVDLVLAAAVQQE